MRIEDLPKIHKIDTEILKSIVEICDRHQIEYFMIYGTLLGTIRHGGPIPWDCDVDLGMTRENYMKFYEIAGKELGPKYRINVMGSGSVKYLSELKVGKNGTWVYLEGTRDLNIMRQIQNDVFLFDYIKPLTPRQTRLYERIRKILYVGKLNWDEKKLIMMVLDEGKRKGRLLYKAGLMALHAMRALITEEGIEKLLYKMFVDETGTSGRMGLVLDGGKLVTWPAESFRDLVKMDYDGLSVTVPANYDQILTDIYGDYMTPPPEDKRYRRHMDRYVLEIHE